MIPCAPASDVPFLCASCSLDSKMLAFFVQVILSTHNMIFHHHDEPAVEDHNLFSLWFNHPKSAISFPFPSFDATVAACFPCHPNQLLFFLQCLLCLIHLQPYLEHFDDLSHHEWPKKRVTGSFRKFPLSFLVA